MYSRIKETHHQEEDLLDEEDGWVKLSVGSVVNSSSYYWVCWKSLTLILSTRSDAHLVCCSVNLRHQFFSCLFGSYY